MKAFADRHKNIWIIGCIIMMIALLVICDKAAAQERTVLYEYNPIQNQDLGNGHFKLTREMGRPFKIVKEGDVIYNISRNDTISYKIWNAEHYFGIGNGNWEDVFEINSDSVVYEFDTKFDIEVKDDTVLFKDKGRIVARQFGFRILDEINWTKAKEVVKVRKYEPYNDRVIYKFDRKNKNEPVLVDPTISWQPDATLGKDTEPNESVPDEVRGTNAWLTIGDIAGVESQIYIEFTGELDTLTALGVTTGDMIDSSYILFTLYSQIGAAFNVHVARVTAVWDEATMTWNNKVAINSPYDTVSVSADGLKKFYTTPILKAYRDGDYTNYGYAIIHLDAANQYNVARSSDYGTVGDRPQDVIYYTIPELTGIIPRVSKGVIQTNKAEGGSIGFRVRH